MIKKNKNNKKKTKGIRTLRSNAYNEYSEKPILLSIQYGHCNGMDIDISFRVSECLVLDMLGRSDSKLRIKPLTHQIWVRLIDTVKKKLAGIDSL